MKKIFYTLPLIILVITLVIQSGCKEDEVVQPVDDSLEKEAISANNLSIMGKIVTDAASSAIIYASGTVPSGTGGCPVIFDSLNSFMVVDYGFPPGCVSSVDGVRRSGAYRIAHSLFPASDSTYCTITFDELRIYKSTANSDTNTIKVSGTVNFSTKKVTSSSYNLKIRGEAFYVNQSSVIKELYLDSLRGTANINSPSDPNDDTFSIYGYQRIKDNKYNITYTVTTASSAPLVYMSNCRYPLSGKLSLSGIEVDFSPNNSVCDAIAKITKGTVSKNIDLSTMVF